MTARTVQPGEAHRGVFVVLEGCEGAGKSTQVARIAAARPSTLVTFEPGDTNLGAALRRILLNGHDTTLCETAEALLMAADRAQHVTETIRPALRAGRDVVCDRYVASSLAYQGYGRGMDLEVVRHMSQIASGGLAADLTILLDVDPAVGRERSSAKRDRFESLDVDFHRRVRAGYLSLASADPRRWVIVDASRPPRAVNDDVAAALRDRLGWKLGDAATPTPAEATLSG